MKSAFHLSLPSALLTNASIRKSLKIISIHVSQIFMLNVTLKPIKMCFFFFSLLDDPISNLRICYYLEIHSAPGPPLSTINMKCIALVRAH